MGKSACIKRIAAVRNYSTNTIMEKKTGGREKGQGYGIFGGKVKNLKIFLEEPIQC